MMTLLFRRRMLNMLIIIAFFLVSSVTALAGTQPSDEGFTQIIPDEIEPTMTTEFGEYNVFTGAPVALWGMNYPVRFGSRESMARQYLTENAVDLHLKHGDLADLSYRVSRQGLAGTTVRFDQYFEGLPVYKAEVAVSINNNQQVTYLASTYKPAAAVESIVPDLIAAEARQLTFDYLNVQGPLLYDETRLVVYSHGDENRLAWQVNVVPRSPLGDWEALVDAHDGAFIKVENIALHLEEHGTGEETIVQLVDGSGNVFDPDPLSSAGAVYGDPGFTDGNDANTSQLIAEQVNVTLPDISFDGGNYSLIGPYAEIIDIEAPFYGLFSQASSDWGFNRFDNAFEAANTYYHIDSSMRYLNLTLGIPVEPFQYSGGVRFDPHGFNGADNSHYLTTLGAVTFGEGGVDDAEDSDVIHHELGHGLHHWITNGSISQVNGLSEGIGDYWAQSYNRSLGLWQPSDPQYQWVFNWDGHNQFWSGRVTNWPNLYPGGLTGQIHTDGQIWSTANMRIWDAIGKTATDTAFWEGIAMTNAVTNQNQAANAVFQAAINLGYSVAELQAIHDEYTATGYTLPPLPVPDFTLSAASDIVEICPGDLAFYDIFVQQINGFTEDVTLSLSNEPVGVNHDFIPNGQAAPYTSTLAISNTTTVSNGSYDMMVTGMSVSAMHTTTLTLDVFESPGMVVLLNPADGSNTSPTPILIWQSEALASSYHLQVATDSNFNDIVIDESGLSDTSYSIMTPLNTATTYYWRVAGIGNACTGVWSSAFSFSTGFSIYLPTLISTN